MSFLTPDAVSRNYGQETRRTLEAQIGLAPQLFQAQSIYQPLYNSLNLQNMDEFLTGTPESTYTTMGWQQPTYLNAAGRRVGGGIGTVRGFGASTGNSGSPGGLSGTFGGIDGGQFLQNVTDPVSLFDNQGDPFAGVFGGDDSPGRRLLTPGRYVPTGTGTRAAQRGFLDIYNEDIIPEMLRAQTTQRTSDIADVGNLGPAAREALRKSNPEAAALLDMLDSQAQSDLAAGAELNPSELRNLQQAGRAGEADRGLGGGPMDAFSEALRSLNYGRGLQNDRRGFAQNILGELERFYGDPFQAILGRSIQPGAQAIGSQGMAGGNIGSLFNPESAYAGQVNDFNANSQQSANNIGASNNAAMLGSIISAIGSLGGGAMSAFGPAPRR